jgi:hypothetical protein
MPRNDDVSDIEEVLELLIADYVSLLSQVRLFGSLFVNAPERVALMNEVSSSFFTQIQSALIADILTGIFRLAGSAATGRGTGARKNLVLKSLLASEYDDQWQGAKDEVEALMSDLEGNLERLEGMRHRQIAHRDFRVATGAEDVERPTFNQINVTMDMMAEILQSAQNEILGQVVMFDPVWPLKDELFVLDLMRIGLEVKNSEDCKELEEAARGNFEYTRSYSPTPDYLIRGD